MENKNQSQEAKQKKLDEDHTIYSMYETVKLNIINRYYELLNQFSNYQQRKIVNKLTTTDNVVMTALITEQWLLIKDYDKSFTKVEDFKKTTKFISDIMKSGSTLNYEGVANTIQFISSLMVKSGLCDIQNLKIDPGRSIIDTNI